MALSLQRIEDKYDILAKISEGGMGSIYRVRHRLLGDERVIKLMRPQLVANEAHRARFVHEARLASRLTHPNIARLYDFTAEDDGFAYIVMELIIGLTLEALIARGARPPVVLGLEIARQGLRAMAHLHRNGLVHRDVSPDNMMLTRTVDGGPLVKLIDLGIAKSTTGSGALTATGMFLGKVRYTSPERFGGAEASVASDIYAFGLVLYELLTGHYPIVGDGTTSIIAGHLFRPPRSFEETDPEGRLPEALRAVLLRTLAKEPAARYDSAQELSELLQAIEKDCPPETEACEATLRLTGIESPAIEQAAAPPAAPPTATVAVPAAELLAKNRDAVEPAADTVAAVEQHIEAGELQAARDGLAALQARHPRNERLQRLAVYLEDAEHRAHRSRVAGFIHQAQAAAVAEDFTAALAALEQAVALTPGDEQLQALLRETEQARRRSEAEARRQAAIAEQAQKIEDLLAAGAVQDARGALRAAGQAFGKNSVLTDLRRRLDDVVETARRAAFAERVAEAREHLASGRITAAMQAIDGAAELEPEHQEISTLRRDAEARQAEEEARRRHARAVAETVAAVEHLLAADRLDEAAEQLGEAVLKLGDGDEFERLAERLENRREILVLRRREAEVARRQRQVAALLAEADALAASEDFADAVARLETAQELSPDDGDVATRLAAMKRRRDDEAAQRAAAAAEKAAREAIESCLDADDLDGAAQALDAAEQAHGTGSPWAALRERLEAARRKARREEVLRLVGEAERLASAADEEAALDVLDRALAIDPGDEAVEERRDGLHKQLLQRRAAAVHEQAISESAGRIEAALKRDDVEGAEALLRGAIDALGDDWVFDALAESVAEARQQQREAAVQDLVRQADRLIADGQLDAAIKALDEATALDPAHPVVRETRRNALQAQEIERRKAERATAIETACAEVEQRIADDDLPAAKSQLEEADQRWGPATAFTSLARRLQALTRERARQEEAVGLRQEAEKLRSTGDLVTASARLEKALRLVPTDADLRQLLEEIRQEAVQQREAAVREEAVAAARGELLALLDSDKLDEARARLRLVEDEHGAVEALAPLAGRIEEGLAARRAAQREEAKRVQAEEALARARSLSQTEDFTAARRAVHQALELAPEDGAAIELSRTIDTLIQLQAQESEEAGALDASVAEIRQLLAAGQRGEAMKELNRAIAQFGPETELRALRYEIAQALLAVDEGNADGDTGEPPPLPVPPPRLAMSAAPPTVATSAAPPTVAVAASARPSPQATSVAGQQEARARTLLEPLSAAPPAAVPSPAQRTTAESYVDLPLGGASGPLVAATERRPVLNATASSQRASAGGIDLSDPKFWLALIAVLVLFTLIGLWLGGIGRGENTPPPAAAEPQLEVEDVPPPTAPPG